MSSKNIFLSLILSIVGQFLHAQSDTTSIRLYGNKNCKSQLEEIASSFENVTSASYDTLNGRMNIRFIGEYNKDMFVFHFASKGYDAENVRAKDVIYNTLSDACKYIRKPEEVVRD